MNCIVWWFWPWQASIPKKADASKRWSNNESLAQAVHSRMLKASNSSGWDKMVSKQLQQYQMNCFVLWFWSWQASIPQKADASKRWSNKARLPQDEHNMMIKLPVQAAVTDLYPDSSNNVKWIVLYGGFGRGKLPSLKKPMPRRGCQIMRV